jgi:hypothetical protein
MNELIEFRGFKFNRPTVVEVSLLAQVEQKHFLIKDTDDDIDDDLKFVEYVKAGQKMIFQCLVNKEKQEDLVEEIECDLTFSRELIPMLARAFVARQVAYKEKVQAALKESSGTLQAQ